MILQNVTIVTSQQTKSGTSQYGAWILYEITLAQHQENFKYFHKPQNKNSIAPQPGMFCTNIEYDIEQKDNYQDYVIKKISTNQAPTPPPQSAPAPLPQPAQQPTQQPINGHSYDIRDLSVMTSYAKDLAIALIEQDKFDSTIFQNACKTVFAGGRLLHKLAKGEKE